MTFQGGDTDNFEIHYSLSSDGLDWTPPRMLTDHGNSHDSFPMALSDGTYAIFYSAVEKSSRGYDLFWKCSTGKDNWSDPMFVGVDNPNHDLEPHAVQLDQNTFVLAWAYESLPPYYDVDIALTWMERRTEDPGPSPNRTTAPTLFPATGFGPDPSPGTSGAEMINVQAFVSIGMLVALVLSFSLISQ